MKIKQRLSLEIKEISDTGSFEGLLSPYGIVDGGGDIVDPGAYTKTMQEHGNTVPMLYQHKDPVGELLLENRPDGLWCKGQLLMALPDAQKAYLLIKNRIVKGLSIGFQSMKDSVEDGVRHLKEIRLYEGSIVIFPMAETALITSVKSREEKDDLSEEITEIHVLDTRSQLMQALQCALSSVIGADFKSEEKISTTDTILQQFADAYTKTGAMLSAANLETIKTACSSIKGGHDSLLALVGDKAGSTTLDLKAAAVVPKPEPVPDHSAIIAQIDELKGVFQWNH